MKNRTELSKQYKKLNKLGREKEIDYSRELDNLATQNFDKKDIETIKRGFEKNKEAIKEHMNSKDEERLLQGFIRDVGHRMLQKNLTASEAVKSTMRSKNYKDEAEVFRENALAGIKDNPKMYEKWRKLTQHRKFNPEDWHYVGNNTYIYNMPNYGIEIVLGDYKKGNQINKVKRFDI